MFVWPGARRQSPARFLRLFTAPWSHTPVAIWIQDLWPETFFAVTKSRNPILRAILRRLVKWIYVNVDQLWMQSPAYEKSLLDHGAQTSQIEFVPNWTEDLYDGSTWVEVKPDTLPANSLVFAGNLGKAQGLENLLDAAEVTRTLHPDAHWVFVGDGSFVSG